MPTMQKVNFDELAQTILQGQATQPYGKPLGHDISTEYDGVYNAIKPPRYPGDLVYFHGPYIMERNEKDLPQGMIDAQHQSIRDAISHYMPIDVVGRHICTFIQSDFTFSRHYRNALRDNKDHLPRTKSNKNPIDQKIRPDYSLSPQFGTAVRKSMDRNYFTELEIKSVHEICKKAPAIIMTVSAFQAACLDYLDHLGQAIAKNMHPNKADKTRAQSVVGLMTQQWAPSNFASEIVPFIALAYHQRDPSLNSPVQGEDFQQGYTLALRMGLYRNQIKSPLPEDNPQAGNRVFTCPARVTIGSLLAQDWNAPQSTRNSNGTLLALIHGHMEKISCIKKETDYETNPIVCDTALSNDSD